MKISLNWLRDIVSWDDTDENLAVKLTAAGLNVEGIENYKLSFPGVVVAKVISREAHPDADRLSLCQVNIGEQENIQVVCGAPNVREGLTVLFAQVGSVLPGNFKIKKSKIRGVVSLGMICSASELQLNDDAEGIMELDDSLAAGTTADELYGFTDTVLDIEVTPNRPDWLSHLGVAREVACLYGTKVAMPETWSSQQSGEKLGIKVKIDDYNDCKRYCAFGAGEITIGQSPEYIQHRLMAVGVRPINNVVDITNYVMFEMGQPLHAFDRAKISGDNIFVRRAAAGTKVVTLDDQERKLDEGTLLICDGNGPVALAGVMGLANSEVDKNTTEVLLESAFFNPKDVRIASRRLNLISEASYRFERGADWSMAEKAARRVLYLLKEHAGAQIVSEWADKADPDHKEAQSIPLRIWQVNRVLGTEISTDEAAQILQSLGLKVQPMGNPSSHSANAVNMMVEVPSFRRDLFQEIDLIEEVARFYGYDNMMGKGTFRGTAGGTHNNADVVRRRIRTWFADCGYYELITSSFFADGDLDRMGFPEGDVRRQTMAVINPNHGGNTELRTCMLPSMLDVARRNLNSGAATPLRLFQLNRVYLPGGEKAENPRQVDEKLLAEEPLFLQFAVAGSREKGIDGIPASLLELKGVVETLSQQLRVPLSLAVEDTEDWLEAGAQWKILDENQKTVGSAGQVTADMLEKFDVDQPVAVAEINLNLLTLEPKPTKFEPFTRFPSVKRDLSLLVPEGLTYGSIEEVIVNNGGDHLVSTELFDVYRGKGVPEGSGAYGIRLKFRSVKGNLKGKTVDKAISAILKALSERFNIEPRS